ncbi:putative ATP-dependent Clp protease proteolytic subunit 1 [Cardiosporidium cionae]|uniref:ATP-dependent Clp protease proteolytic subunit 1 n=1 Tax=Cardiosporidium cionae TaxID=476202 RepID=A0ABQ7J5P9_9APIC|nr:putative ATP-dependent Clp protease proteolytic subunit 1 [Cardiosporidium cionae]|eukprot:KAF8819302.1 putative ATP-dependent Clp protease proteolytic subunit 1 [Cardiosporidium cionae]
MAVSDVTIEVRECMKENKRLLSVLARNTPQPIEKLKQDFQRSFYLSASEAVSYGLIDTVLLPKNDNVTEDRESKAFFGHFGGKLEQRYQQNRGINGWGGPPPHVRSTAT